MYAQGLVSILILLVVWYVGYKFIYKPYTSTKTTNANIKEKLETQKDVLRDTKEEVVITKELNKIDKELSRIKIKTQK